MKAITLYPEHAEAFKLGLRTIETRPRRCNYRGRVALHAGMRDPDSAAARRDPISAAVMAAIPHGRPLARGAVVASAVLTDCAPIGGPFDFRTGYAEGDEGDFPGQAVVVRHPDFGHGESLVISTADTRTVDITDQLPYGDFTPGRWALLLDDIKPTTERCPACWGSLPEAAPGVCVDIDGARWHDPGACPLCTPLCSTCGAVGRCDPIPARGQQAVPWEWAQ